MLNWQPLFLNSFISVPGVPTVSGKLSTFKPVLVVVSALQLRFILQVQQQVGQDFAVLISMVINRQQLFCRLDELIVQRARAE